ncbi:hypothetical protein C474_11021 [Halogeometricum pallidum JCM 14848]|uniref:Uncharacterized protein n=1 Tax=Halogeometricum pallidum JCM 14848 TaxID=1227487 RepID=M0DA19_HALPD|nr:hypothetical protein [Halogeometricum pallidum]ELZ30989.1 hypothetical protein C474_11021 [Halogeometricum pallidum JCM 14848]
MPLRLLERLRAFVSSDRERDSVWNVIPRWQYDGLHVESGGIARGEQEKALDDIERQADEIDGRSR